MRIEVRKNDKIKEARRCRHKIPFPKKKNKAYELHPQKKEKEKVDLIDSLYQGA